MGIFSFLKADKQDKITADKVGSSTSPAYQSPPQNDMFKAYIPNFLYKPPFGYPLNKNVLHLKALAKNPFIFSVIRTLKDEASTSKWEIKYKKEFATEAFKDEKKEELKRISAWFYNPNGNEESFNDIVGQWVQDICEVDAAVGVKVFDKSGKFSQLFARDGGSILKNPDIYGYLGNRDEIVYPYADINPNLTTPYNIKVYSAAYAETAAYYQYGWTGNALPVPFGRREIVYIMSNPRTDGIYGRSPLEVIEDILLTLVYGTQYNTDFYINGNMPDGMINLVGADQEIAKAFQDRMKDKFKTTDTSLGNSRRIGHQYPVYGGPDAKFVPFQLSSKDMEIIEQQKWFTKLVWSAFGVTPDEMGYTEDSNKAVSQTQTGVHKRKALKPILKKIEYAINSQIMPELDPSGKFEFAFEDFDLDEELKKAQLYDLQIKGGWKTAEMVAEEEGIDMEKLKAHKEEQAKKDMEMAQQTNPGFLPDKGPSTKSNHGYKDFNDCVKQNRDQDDPIEYCSRLMHKINPHTAKVKAVNFNEQLEKGIKVEMEHTSDKEIATKIATDHLMENPEYYIYLEEMEKKMKKESINKYKTGDIVKIMSSSNSHIGKMGKIGQVYNNGFEDYYEVITNDGIDILFAENMKKLRDANFSLSNKLISDEVLKPLIEPEQPKVKAIEHDDEVSDYFKKIKEHLLKEIEKEENGFKP